MPSKSSGSKKRNAPEHNTPPDKGREKKTKADGQSNPETSPEDSKQVIEQTWTATMLTNMQMETKRWQQWPQFQTDPEECYCDRCTDQADQLIQCERCICEEIPDWVISFIGECSKFRVH